LGKAISPSFIGSSGKHNETLCSTKLTSTEVLEGGVSVLKALNRPRDTGGRRRPPERKNLPARTALLSFDSAINSGELPSNPDELVAIRVTKISEISAIWAHAWRILDRRTAIRNAGLGHASAILASLIKKPIVPPLAEPAGLPSMGLVTMKRPPLCE
jgi:hypothetical protein